MLHNICPKIVHTCILITCYLTHSTLVTTCALTSSSLPLCFSAAKKEYFIDPNGGSSLDRISVTCKATEDGEGYYTCIRPAMKNVSRVATTKPTAHQSRVTLHTMPFVQKRFCPVYFIQENTACLRLSFLVLAKRRIRGELLNFLLYFI